MQASVVVTGELANAVMRNQRAGPRRAGFLLRVLWNY